MKNIVLTGMMGSGKTTIGLNIAQTTNNLFKFVDIDFIIESECKCKITELFEQKGEQFFRQKETEVVTGLSEKHGLVIATGGGAVIRDENIKLLKKCGVLFYLKTDIATILGRTQNDTTRPLLNNTDKQVRLINLLNERQKQYEKSDFIIQTNNKTVEEITTEILRLYEQ